MNGNKYCEINSNKVGHLLSELGFHPHSTPQFQDLTNYFTIVKFHSQIRHHNSDANSRVDD